MKLSTVRFIYYGRASVHRDTLPEAVHYFFLIEELTHRYDTPSRGC
jgi:hypothetical protein